MKLKIFEKFGGSRSFGGHTELRKYGLPLSDSDAEEAVKRDFIEMDAIHGGLLGKLSEALGDFEEINEVTDQLVGPERKREVGFSIKTGKAKVKAHYNPYDSPTIEIVAGGKEWGFRREPAGDETVAGFASDGKEHYVVYGTLDKESYYSLIEPKSLKGKARLAGSISGKLCQLDDDGYFRGAVKAEAVPDLVGQLVRLGGRRIGWPKSERGVELHVYDSFQKPTKVNKNGKGVSIGNEAEEIKDTFLELDSFYDGIVKRVFGKLGGIDEIDASAHSHRYDRRIHLKVAKDGKELVIHENDGFVRDGIGVLMDGDHGGGIFSKKGDGDYWFSGMLKKDCYENLMEKHVVEPGPCRWSGNGSWMGEVKVDAKAVPEIIGRMMAAAGTETPNQKYIG